MNSSGVVAGVGTRYPYSQPYQTGFLAQPIVWSSAATLPVDLTMSPGVFVGEFADGDPLIDI